MSPSRLPSAPDGDTFEDNLNLSVVGLGSEYPAFHNPPSCLDELAKRHYPESPALTKVLSINRFTGIETRSAIGDINHPIVNQCAPPTIKELNELFMRDGVVLSVAACKKALSEWAGPVSGITHMVSTTCTSSANPGFDHFVAKELGLSSSVHKTLLAGIGCSGGLAAIRTASELALSATARGRPARVLVLACEISSVFVRSELESIHENQEVRIGICLFGDAASACVISNGIGDDVGRAISKEPIFKVLCWRHEVIGDTEADLGFDVDPLGWKVVLTPRVPGLTTKAVFPAYCKLMEQIPALHQEDGSIPSPLDFDWALHPGGSLIINGVQRAMGLDEYHLRASYEIYMEHGNSSSATIMSVLDRIRQPRHVDKSKNIVSCAFGPGINLELVVLERGQKEVVGNGHVNGHVNEVVNGVVNGTVNGAATGNVNGATNGTTSGLANGSAKEKVNGNGVH